LKPKLRRSRRGLLASGASLLVLLVFVFGGFGYFFSSAAQQRHDIVMPVPGLPDLAGDQAAAYGKFERDGALNAALVEPAFTQVRSRLDGVRVVFVPSYLSDVALPSVALGKSLGYMAGIYSWLGDAGIETEIADIETEDSVVANAAAHGVAGRARTCPLLGCDAGTISGVAGCRSGNRCCWVA